VGELRKFQAGATLKFPVAHQKEKARAKGQTDKKLATKNDERHKNRGLFANTDFYHRVIDTKNEGLSGYSR
jgi:hypothetical protein